MARLHLGNWKPLLWCPESTGFKLTCLPLDVFLDPGSIVASPRELISLSRWASSRILGDHVRSDPGSSKSPCGLQGRSSTWRVSLLVPGITTKNYRVRLISKKSRNLSIRQGFRTPYVASYSPAPNGGRCHDLERELQENALGGSKQSASVSPKLLQVGDAWW